MNSSFVQVKVTGSPAVYYLSWKYQVKKTYINSSAYLSYGNSWSNIKTVRTADLRSWPEAKLFKVTGSSAIYYISGQQKVLVQSLEDLSRFKLVGQPVLAVSATDLAQYQLVDYATVGWTAAADSSNAATGNSNNSSTPTSSGTLEVYSDLATSTNGNSLVSNTTNNLLGSFRFQASAATTFSAVTFNLVGVYDSSAINNVKAENAGNTDYSDSGSSVSWRSSDRQIIVTFHPALTLAAGESATVKILADLQSCPNCNGQTLYLALPAAAAITASTPAAPANGAWPLVGTTFNLVAASNVLGQPVAQMASIASSTSGTRLIGQLSIAETSGNEDILVQQLTFSNGGSASVNDWNNFVLLEDGQVISRTSALNNNGQIVFAINYLKVPAQGSVDLTVTAGLLSGYNTQATYNLQLASMKAVGVTSNLTLTPVINNISEVLILN
jgi:hypothetical protein